MQINHINCNCYTARNSIGSDQHKSIKPNIFRNFLCWDFTYCTWCRASLSNPTSSSDILQTCQFQNLLRHPERFLQNKNMTILTFKKIVGKIGPQIGNARQGKKLWVKLVLTHTMHMEQCVWSWSWYHEIDLLQLCRRVLHLLLNEVCSREESLAEIFDCHCCIYCHMISSFQSSFFF